MVENKQDESPDQIIEKWRKYLPPYFARKSVPILIPGVNAGTLANDDSKGVGPGIAYRHKRNVMYERDQFLDWYRRDMV